MEGIRGYGQLKMMNVVKYINLSLNIQLYVYCYKYRDMFEAGRVILYGW